MVLDLHQQQTLLLRVCFTSSLKDQPIAFLDKIRKIIYADLYLSILKSVLSLYPN
jgi:hypothetical protein